MNLSLAHFLYKIKKAKFGFFYLIQWTLYSEHCTPEKVLQIIFKNKSDFVKNENIWLINGFISLFSKFDVIKREEE